MSTEKHKSKDGVLFFDASKCIHSRNCVLNRPDVFVPNVEGEWIHPENADGGELAAIADACPSGAIRFEAKGKLENKPLVNTLHVRENGPYAIKAEIKLAGQAKGNRLALCRCGASKNKPYCDGSHIEANFSATGEPNAKDSPTLEQRDGALSISPQPNGPLKVEGNLEICAGTGHTINRVEQAYLCRCGASQNKPYCDGSHNKIGFSTDE